MFGATSNFFKKLKVVKDNGVYYLLTEGQHFDLMDIHQKFKAKEQYNIHKLQGLNPFKKILVQQQGHGITNAAYITPLELKFRIKAEDNILRRGPFKHSAIPQNKLPLISANNPSRFFAFTSDPRGSNRRPRSGKVHYATLMAMMRLIQQKDLTRIRPGQVITGEILKRLLTYRALSGLLKHLEPNINVRKVYTFTSRKMAG